MSELRPTTDDSAELLYQISDPFSLGAIIYREITLHHHTVQKSVRRGLSDLRAEKGTLELIARRTAVPVPRVSSYALSADFEHLYMSKIPGETLETIWPELSIVEREQIADHVVQLILELQKLRSSTIDAALLHRKSLRRGINNTVEFYKERLQSYEWCSPACDYVTKRVAALGELPNIFTHGDLGWTNIMILDKKVCGIIDFKSSGFSPPYWEWLSARTMCGDLSADTWDNLLEVRLRRELDIDLDAVWEVEELISALTRHSEWALSPEDRRSNRSAAWPDVNRLLGTDIPPPHQVAYSVRSKHPWWMDYVEGEADACRSSSDHVVELDSASTLDDGLGGNE